MLGGDVLPGPMPVETLACLLNRKAAVRFIQGKGEVAVLAHLAGKETSAVPEQARAVGRWTAQQVRPQQQRELNSWPKTIQIEIRGIGEVLFCHAAPRNEDEIFTRLTSEERL